MDRVSKELRGDRNIKYFLDFDIRGVSVLEGFSKGRSGESETPPGSTCELVGNLMAPLGLGSQCKACYVACR